MSFLGAGKSILFNKKTIPKITTKAKTNLIIKPRKIRTPDDIRPGTKKGKLDTNPIWVVEIMMPKKLIADIYTGYKAQEDFGTEPANPPAIAPEATEQPAETGAEETAGTEELA